MFLVLGARGMLGRAWAQHLRQRGAAFETLDRPAFDLARPDSLLNVDWGRFETVVNCAAWTDVDGAEEAEDAATAANGAGVQALARATAAAGSTLVHYSTDYVFAGDARVPYTVDTPHAPVNAYGRSKAAGELGIAQEGGHHLLVRTSWVYAAWGKNFVRTIAALCRDADTLAVVDDQRGRPSSATALAATTASLLAAGATGTYHATDGGDCTWFDLASATAMAINPACRVEPCASDRYPRPAKRPAYSVLDLERTEAIVGKLERWEQALVPVLQAISATPGR